MKKSFFLVILFSLITNCSDNPISPETEIMEARQKWQSQEYEAYSFNYIQDCFCVWGGVDFRISVSENKIIDVVDVDGNVQVDSSEYKYLYTIDQLFDYLEKLVKEKPEQLDYSFHPQIGYPKTIYVDYSREVADDEFGFKIDSLLVPIR